MQCPCAKITSRVGKHETSYSTFSLKTFQRSADGNVIDWFSSLNVGVVNDLLFISFIYSPYIIQNSSSSSSSSSSSNYDNNDMNNL